jgi:hypothetical protein
MCFLFYNILLVLPYSLLFCSVLLTFGHFFHLNLSSYPIPSPFIFDLFRVFLLGT